MRRHPLRHPIETWRVAEDTVRLWLEAGPPGDRISLKAGRTVYEQGEVSPYFYFVLSGKLKVSVLRPDGTELVMEFMGKGALCGEAAAFDGLPRFSMATVLEDATLVRFNAEKISDAIRDTPDLAFSLLRLISVKQRIATVRLAYSALSSAEVRIAELLRRLGEIYTEVELTHEEIAGLTGTTRVTVTRALKRLALAGVIENEAGRIRVLDPLALDAR
jgi:CRP/FNR family transcriptional regulator, cyclic AMP receptor protein